MFLENIKEALSSIVSNKMRSVLTMLGIIIGISSVITITTIGQSISSTLNYTFNSIIGNQIYIYLSYDNYDDEDWGLDEKDYLTEEMIDEFNEKYPDEIVGIERNMALGAGTVKDDEIHYANVSVEGGNSCYFDTLSLKILCGRALTEEDDEKAKSVCLVSDKLVKYYYDNENPIGKSILVETGMGSIEEYYIVGVYKYYVSMMNSYSKTDQDITTSIYIPFNTAKNASGNKYDYNNGYTMTVSANPDFDNDKIVADLKEFFDKKYANVENWSIEVMSVAQSLQAINTVMAVITIAVSGIAAISLIVGGVGVMNIMLVSITERTREIGVRMALGAKRKIIRMQFVMEAIVLCIIGGIIGILTGVLNGMIIGKIATYVISSAYSDFADYIIVKVQPSVTAILLSLFFSMLVGIFFGFYPANKASKMEVIDALRYE